MSERLSTEEITYHVIDTIKGKSPLVAVLGWLRPSQILLGRDRQRWLITIQEIPAEDKL